MTKKYVFATEDFKPEDDETELADGRAFDNLEDGFDWAKSIARKQGLDSIYYVVFLGNTTDVFIKGTLDLAK